MEGPSFGERVCLYLDAVERRTRDPRYVGASMDPAPGPSTVPPRTVLGIARTLELHRGGTADPGTLLGTLADLAAEDLLQVEETTAGRTPRRVYRLTDAGRRRAGEVRERVESRTVTVADGTTRDVPLGDLDRYFEEYPLVRGLARLAGTDRNRVRVREGSDQGFEGEFVDRTEELDELGATLSTVEKRGGQAVLVSGRPGVGKTALVRRLLNEARERGFRVVSGRCRRGSDRPYAPLLAAVRGLSVGDPAVDSLAAGVGHEPDDSDALEAGRTALYNELADDLRAAAHDQPLVVAADDLQWASVDARRLFVHLARAVTERINPVLFVATYRSDGTGDDGPFDDVVGDLVEDERTHHLRLGGLPDAASRRLLERRAGHGDLPDPVVAAVHERTRGIPLSIREAARQLVDHGASAATTGDDRGTAPTDPDDLPGPEAMGSAAATRLSELPEDTHEVLAAAAVVGDTVDPALVAAVLEEAEAVVNDHLDVLVAAGALDRTEGDVAFVGSTVRESVLEGIPDGRRRSLHTAVAEAIEADAPDRRAPRVAHHYEAAGDLAAALEYYHCAGNRARRGYAFEAATDAYERALAVAERRGDGDAEVRALEALGETAATLGRRETARAYFGDAEATATDVPTRQRLIRKRSETYVAGGDYEAAIETADAGLALDDGDVGDADAASPGTAGLLTVTADALTRAGSLEEAEEVARRARDHGRAAEAPEREARALEQLGTVARRRGKYGEAAEHLEASLDVERERGSRDDRADILDELGTVAYQRGAFAEAAEYHDRALATYRETGNKRGEATSLKNRGRVARRRGDIDTAMKYYERSLETHRAIGDRKGQADDLNNLGIIAYDRGNFVAAAEYFEDCLPIYRETGYRIGEAMALNNLGRVALRRGDLAAAEEYFEEGLAIYRDADDHRFVPTTVFNLGKVAHERGDLDTAEEYFEESLSLFRDTENRAREARLLTNLGRVALDRGDPDTAEEYVERSLDVARTVDQPDREGEALIVRGAVATERGAFERAREAIETGLEIVRAADRLEFELEGLLALGDLERIRGDLGAATDAYERALDLAGDGGYRLRALTALKDLARTARRRGDPDRARTYCEEALGRIEDSDAAAVADREETFRSLLGEL